MNKNEVEEHFGKQAGSYEELMVKLIPGYLEQHAIIYDLLPEEEKAYRVLDLGCGNGVLSEQVLKKYPHARIVGFDLTEEMLKAYKTNFLNIPTGLN